MFTESKLLMSRCGGALRSVPYGLWTLQQQQKDSSEGTRLGVTGWHVHVSNSSNLSS